MPGSVGATPTGGIWRNCALNQWMEQGVAHIPPSRELPGTDVQSPYIIVGNGAFPLTEPLQRQCCRHNMEEREMIFNDRLSRARHISENASWPAVCCTTSCVGGAARHTSQTCWRPTRPRPQQLRATSSRSNPTWTSKSWRTTLWGWGPYRGNTKCLVNL